MLINVWSIKRGPDDKLEIVASVDSMDYHLDFTKVINPISNMSISELQPNSWVSNMFMFNYQGLKEIIGQGKAYMDKDNKICKDLHIKPD